MLFLYGFFDVVFVVIVINLCNNIFLVKKKYKKLSIIGYD